MSTTDELIASLASQAAASKAPPPSRLFVRWAAGSVLYALFIVAMYGMRPDISPMLSAPLFITELFLLALLTATSGMAAAVFSFPDLYQRRGFTLLPAVTAAAFALLLCIGWRYDNAETPPSAHGVECLICITLFTMLPAAWLLYVLKRQLSTHYYLTGGSIMLAASSLACLMLRLIEANNSMLHLITWHYLPLIGFGTIGLWLGRKFFSW